MAFILPEILGARRSQPHAGGRRSFGSRPEALSLAWRRVLVFAALKCPGGDADCRCAGRIAFFSRGRAETRERENVAVLTSSLQCRDRLNLLELVRGFCAARAFCTAVPWCSADGGIVFLSSGPALKKATARGKPRILRRKQLTPDEMIDE